MKQVSKTTSADILAWGTELMQLSATITGGGLILRKLSQKGISRSSLIFLWVWSCIHVQARETIAE